MYPADPSIWKTAFAPTNSMENSLTTTSPSASSSMTAPYITAEDKIHHHAVFGFDYTGPCTWYTRGISSLGVEEEQDSIKKETMQVTIGKETLMIATMNDAVCSPERARIGMQAGVEGGLAGGKLAFVEVDSGHWAMLECAEETNRALENFFENGVKGFGTGGIKASL
jgi:soluble epoxide hydrolase/lipid-phosphate phosphatase